MNEEKLTEQTVEAAVKQAAGESTNEEIAQKGAQIITSAFAGSYVVGAVPIPDLPNVVLVNVVRLETDPETGQQGLVGKQLILPNPAMPKEELKPGMIMPGVGGLV